MTRSEDVLQVTSGGDAWRLTIEQFELVEDGSFGRYEQLPDAEIHVVAHSAGDAIAVGEAALGTRGPKSRIKAVAVLGTCWQEATP